jgi:hypothetical protein
MFRRTMHSSHWILPCLALGLLFGACLNTGDGNPDGCLELIGSLEDAPIYTLVAQGGRIVCASERRVACLEFVGGQPVLVSETTLDVRAYAIGLWGSTGILTGPDGAQLFTLSPENVISRGATLDGLSSVWDVAMAPGLVAAIDYQGIHLVDVRNPNEAEALALIPCPDSLSYEGFTALAMDDDLLVAGGSHGLAVYDISEPRLPVLLSQLETHYFNHVVVSDGWAYIMDDVDNRYVLRALDLQNPSVPLLSGYFMTSPYSIDELSLAGTQLFALGYARLGWEAEYGLFEFNIENPGVPRLREMAELDGWYDELAAMNGVVLVRQYSRLDAFATCEGLVP